MEVLAVGREEDETMEKEMSETRTDKIINHIKAFEPGQYPVVSDKEDAKIIVSALQDQAEREKGCEYCNNGKQFETDSPDRDDVSLNGNYLEIGIAVSDSYGETEIKMNFCPNCGRDLRKLVNPNE